MSTAGAAWQFTSKVRPIRATALLAWSSFDQIIEQIVSCPVAPLYWEPATAPHLKSCHRAAFEIDVPPNLYDAFFNSPVGYRGQFANSEARGELANRNLIDRLLSSLTFAAGEHPANSDGRVLTSLRGAQAKVWIVESEVDEQLSDPEPSIIYPTWEFNAPDGQGLRAPLGSKLEVKGAWVDAAGLEVVNPSKRRRSNFIYMTGDSK
jgi:hypothetical protein